MPGPVRKEEAVAQANVRELWYKWCKIGVYCLTACYFIYGFAQTRLLKPSLQEWSPSTDTKSLVPFEAHIMSKCPDTQVLFLCLEISIYFDSLI